MDEIVLASSNIGKTVEIKNFLRGLPLSFKTQSDYKINSIHETGSSYLENALLKAKHAYELTKQPVISEDSGLEILAWDRRPGINTADYIKEISGHENYANYANYANPIEKILSQMKDLPLHARRARLSCVIVFIDPKDPQGPFVFHGSLNGYIAQESSKNKGPAFESVFYLPEFSCMLSDLPEGLRGLINHRGQALTKMKNYFLNKPDGFCHR